MASEKLKKSLLELVKAGASLARAPFCLLPPPDRHGSVGDQGSASRFERGDESTAKVGEGVRATQEHFVCLCFFFFFFFHFVFFVADSTRGARAGWSDSIVVIGGDVSPIDVVTHIPILCEDADIPYVYVPSRQELGQAAATKRATTLVLIRAPEAGSALAKDFDAIFKTVSNLKATVM